MTVTYTAEVATCRGFGCFLKLLFRWRGSIYKLVWLDLLSFLLLYYFLNLTYRVFLDEDGKRIFEGIVEYCHTYSDLIPLSFVLGFYVSIVMTRWWNQYISIPWPDPIAVFVSANIHGQDDRGRLMRRTIMRYVCLCQTMVLTMISPKVKKRFPTLDHLVESGLLLDNEKAIMTNLNNKFPKPSKHWLPVVWAASIVTRARKEGRIRDDFAVKTIIDELNIFRGKASVLVSYDTISVPLVYTQVVTLAVYSYFITSAMGRQWTESRDKTVNVSNMDLYFPVFTTLQFFFYMGWLKVAESLINPFGEDDDDFEVNWMIDRNLQVSYMIVDEMHHEHPELIKDQYWDEVFPFELPYTLATEGLREEHPQPSTAKIEVPPGQQGMVTVNPSSIKINEMANQESVSYKFPPVENMTNEDAISGIHFTAGLGRQSSKRRDRMMAIGSQGSLQSNMNNIPGSLTRVNSVTSVLKRLFSREDSNRPPLTPTSQPDGNEKFGKLTHSNSSASITGKYAGGGGVKITNEIIEEVDEQNTITSMATKGFDLRPTAESIFAMGPPPPSAPVNVPQATHQMGLTLDPANPRRPKGESLSSSAPTQLARFSVHVPSSVTTPTSESIPMDSRRDSGPRSRLDSDIGPALSAAGSQFLANEEELVGATSQDSVNDEFHRLKAEREKQRKERYMQKLIARSISAQQAVGGGDAYYADNEVLLMDIGSQSKSKAIEIIKSKEEINEDEGPENT